LIFLKKKCQILRLAVVVADVALGDSTVDHQARRMGFLLGTWSVASSHCMPIHIKSHIYARSADIKLFRLVCGTGTEPIRNQAEDFLAETAILGAIRHSSKFSLNRVVVARILWRLVIANVLKVDRAA
jgi:hypothetical protein